MSIYSPITGERERNSQCRMKPVFRAVVWIAAFCTFLGLWRLVSMPASVNLEPRSSLPESLEGTPDRPIVGILSLTLTDAFREAHHIHQEGIKAVIPSSYVRWLQSAGAQVVVIPHFWPEVDILDLVSKLSGVLFTGGDYGDEAWNSTTALIFNEVIRRNGTGDPLALWATCLGYERVLQIASSDDVNTVVKATVLDESLKVSWQDVSNSMFLRFMGESSLAAFERHPIAYNHHFWGVTPDSWTQHSGSLDPLFSIVGMHDYESLEFVAMIEGKNTLPIWGVQFHPEKALFEWSPTLKYPHSETAVLNNRKIADFFVSQVRKFAKLSTSRGFDNFEDESKYAIYNYATIFTGADLNATQSVFTETYIIN